MHVLYKMNNALKGIYFLLQITLLSLSNHKFFLTGTPGSSELSISRKSCANTDACSDDFVREYNIHPKCNQIHPTCMQ